MSGRAAKHPGLIRINKTGEMRLKNKVSNAILKENTYEERALRTRLQTIKKHQDRNDRYLAHKQLEFATNQVSASEERPFTTGSSGQDPMCKDKPLSLPPINDNARKTAVSKSAPELRRLSRDGTTGSGRTKGRWEKAISLVRQAVSQRSQRANKPLNMSAHTVEDAKEKLALSDKTTNFPPIDQTRDGRMRKKGVHRQLSFPDMIQASREKSQLGLQDPRFQRLEKCLQEGLSNVLRHTDTQPPQRQRVPTKNRMSTF